MTDRRTDAAISIVVPFHNEELNVIELYGRLKDVLEELSRDYQLVFVDDGSTDRTYRLLKELAELDPHVLAVRLRRNFGQTAALAAGFAHSTREYVIAMDGDLQHDPAEIPAFLTKIEEGYDIVSGWRSHRIDNLLLRKIPSRCANWLMAKLSGVDIHDFGTTFKAYRGDLLRQLPLYGEMHRFIPAIASVYGASICEIPIQNVHRKHGESHYNISRTFRVFFDLMTIRFLSRYMSRPLHFFGRLGAISIGLGSMLGSWLLIWKVVTQANLLQVHGVLLAFAAILVLAGFQLVALGLLGELNVWQYFNPTGRKAYAVSETFDLHTHSGVTLTPEERL